MGVVGHSEHGLIAFRDPAGIRPLIWAKKADGTLPTSEAHLFSSESATAAFLGYDLVRDLAPGEVVFIHHQSGKVFTRVVKKSPPKRCMFEWVYFASPESVIETIPVYGSRIRLGEELAKLVEDQIASGEISPDLIVPVPETSRIAAIALAEKVRLPYRELLIKNRYIKRTFILDSQKKRQDAVNLKLSPVRSEFAGKNVLLVDDSIVRGTTSKKIIELVRKAGAKQVYFVSTCPPIQFPCYYGIDFPSPEELIAAGKTNAQIRELLGADQVIYQEIPGLRRAIEGAQEGSLCLGCLDGKYPTDVTCAASFTENRNLNRASSARDLKSVVRGEPLSRGKA